MFKSLIDNDMGDITLYCRDGQVKAISYILKNCAPGPLLKDFDEKKIEFFKEYSVNSTKYFLNHLYETNLVEIPDIYDERLLIFFEVCDICDKLFVQDLDDDIFKKILKTESIFLEKQIYKLFNNYFSKKINIKIEFVEQLIDFLISKIESKEILITNLDLPNDFIKIIFDKMLSKHNIYMIKKGKESF
jgi:hypothetical protein